MTFYKATDYFYTLRNEHFCSNLSPAYNVAAVCVFLDPWQ